MAKKTEVKQVVEVKAEVVTNETSVALVNANITTEQQVQLGAHAIRILTNEKRTEIAELMKHTRARKQELDADIDRVIAEFEHADNAGVKKLEKRFSPAVLKQLGSSLTGIVHEFIAARVENTSTVPLGGESDCDEDEDAEDFTELVVNVSTVERGHHLICLGMKTN